MSNLAESVARSGQRRPGGKPAMSLVILLALCSPGNRAEAETNAYVFVPGESTVTKTGGFAGVHEIYSVSGQFWLSVDFEAGIASFEMVDANLTDETGVIYAWGLGEIFNMTALIGRVVDETTVKFEGKTAGRTDNDVQLKLTLRDDSARLTGTITPPPNSADMFFYDLEAVATASGKYGGGPGEPNAPYLIYTPEQMNAIGAEPNDWGKHFKLMADIDLSGFTDADFNIIGYWRDWDDNAPFSGVFDGNGHTISNFTFVYPDANHVGLFGYLDGPEAEIKDLGLIDPNVDAGTGQSVGSLVGELRGGTISGCFVQGGTVSGGEDVGGLVGYGNGFWRRLPAVSRIVNCYAITNVIGLERIGGLVGRNESTTISLCYSTGSVSGAGITGGLVGQNGNWLSGREGGLFIGGLIHDCYSDCDVIAVATAGGLVGFNYVGEITRCYSSGAVLDSEPNRPVDSNDGLFGGLVGDNEASVKDCLWDVETSGLAVSAGGTGKTTVQMQTAETFLSWGACGSLWTIDEGHDYPRHAWEDTPGQLISGPAYGGGSGTAEKPFLIYTAEQLNTIGQNYCHWDKHFKLMADVDLRAFDGIDGRPAFNVIGQDRWDAFTGVFNGNGHTISHLTLTGVDRLGMFGHMGSGAEVADLGLVDVNISGSGNFIGALAGYSKGDLNRCDSSGTVSGDWSVGGLVGSSWEVLDQCHSSCVVTGGDWIGGLVGTNSSTLTQCYSTGAVSGNWRVGGLVGHNGGSVTHCYSTAVVSGGSSSSTGGLIGLDYDFNDFGYRDVSLSFWDTETSGQTTSNGGTGKTTAEMQTVSTFLEAGWDFVDETANGTEDIWWILEGQDYPRLWWETAGIDN